jgi:predicted GNAT superfamily acetyltransferase
MAPFTLRAATTADFDRIVTLNAAEVHQTSAMDTNRLHELARVSSHLTVAESDGIIAAFLIAMREGADYPNENFAWFAARYEAFVYVDRIVVGAEYAGQRIGTLLYENLFASARAEGIRTVTCEYNIEPPNPASQRFHDRFGFHEVGSQWVAGGRKRVSLQVAEL